VLKVRPQRAEELVTKYLYSMAEIRCIFELFALRSVGKKSIMCDYSLYEFPNRLAREGEELVTYRFPLGSMGLVSPVELEKAQSKPSGNGFWGTVRIPLELSSYRPSDRPSVCVICVPPGARLILKDISPLMQRDLGLCPEEGGKFIETSIDLHRHRDAIQLANGCVIPLQHLQEGQRVEVLSLVPAGEFVEERQSALVR
jgi:hypothetical protein